MANSLPGIKGSGLTRDDTEKPYRVGTPGLLIAFTLCLSVPLQARVDVTKVAAISTIAVNVLTIKTTIQNARKAARTTGHTVKSVAKKVAGK